MMNERKKFICCPENSFQLGIRAGKVLAVILLLFFIRSSALSITMSDISNDSPSVPQSSFNNPTTTDPTKVSTHTSESHSVQITTIRLNGENFLRWSQSVRMYIRGCGKMGYLTGEKKAPEEDDPDYAT